ncbi:MAG: hypothetical protein H7Y22_16190 [Gemmatimonadaceae bacterium]|nr:hypothetical protein [Gloeobacterales cyanobacterium ES-bin-141]
MAQVKLFPPSEPPKLTGYHEPDCSFCGATKLQVRYVIAGPQVYICYLCVERCNKVLS